MLVFASAPWRPRWSVAVHCSIVRRDLIEAASGRGHLCAARQPRPRRGFWPSLNHRGPANPRLSGVQPEGIDAFLEPQGNGELTDLTTTLQARRAWQLHKVLTVPRVLTIPRVLAVSKILALTRRVSRKPA